MDIGRDGVRLLALGRICAGAGMLARPELLPRLVGVDAATAARVAWLGRMLGAREVALGAGTLVALRRGSGAGLWLVGSALSDAVDAAAFGGAVARGHIRPVFGALVTATAAAGAGVGLAGWRALGSAPTATPAPAPARSGLRGRVEQAVS
jgi:hypothetical protein